MSRVAAETSWSSVGGANSALPWKGSPRKPIESSYPAPIRSASPISPRYHCSAAWSIVHGTRSRPGRPWRRPAPIGIGNTGRSAPTSAASSRVPAPAARTTAAAGIRSVPSRMPAARPPSVRTCAGPASVNTRPPRSRTPARRLPTQSEGSAWPLSGSHAAAPMPSVSTNGRIRFTPAASSTSVGTPIACISATFFSSVGTSIGGTMNRKPFRRYPFSPPTSAPHRRCIRQLSTAKCASGGLA